MKVKLGDLTKTRTGKLDANASTDDGAYPFFTCSREPLKISSYSYDCECVLVAGNGDLNVKYYNGKFDAYQRTYIIEAKQPDVLYMPYLYYFMEKYIVELRKLAIGGVIKYIKLGNLTDALIELPSYNQQRSLVERLEKVKSAIDKRNEQLEKLDELVRCRFVELFGDPGSNPRKWPIVTVQDIVTEVKYGTSRPAVAGGKYPYLRMNNITYDGKLDLSDVKRIDVPDDELPKCTVKRGDILFNRTNSKELVGKTCLYDKDELMVLAGFIIRVRVNERVIPEFVVQFMNMPTTKALLFAMCRNAVSQANINAKELQNISIYLPSLDIQKQFSAFTHRIDKLRFK